MAISVDAQPRSGYLHVTFTGDFSLEHACEAYLAVIKAARTHGQQRILIDCLDLHGNPSMTDRLALGEFYAKQRFDALVSGEPTSYQIAFVGRPPLMLPDMPGFKPSNERGGNSLTFQRIDAALNWLGIQT